jgi:hypothetical protein
MAQRNKSLARSNKFLARSNKTRTQGQNDTKAEGQESLHVVVTDDGIGTAGYNSFQFPSNGMFQGQANGLQWNEQIVINGTPITSPDQIVDVGGGPYSISAIFDVSILPGSSGGSFFNQFVVSPTPVSLPVPGPVVGAGLPGLMAFAMLLLARYRKRRFA